MLNDKLTGLSGSLKLQGSQSVLFVPQRAIDDFSDVIGGKRIQHQNLTARKQRRDHFKRRILCSGADQNQGPAFYVGQEVILLGFVEVVNLVDKKNGAFAETLKRSWEVFDMLSPFRPSAFEDWFP